MKLDIPGQPKPYVMAHRGNSEECPENTLAAFRRAIDDGANLIETDLHLTRDGVIVCIHDPTVDRTTDGAGAVADKTLDELKRLSASYGRPEFAGERIPTLDEVLALLPPSMILALELKTDRFLEPAVCRQLADQLEQAGRRDRSVILSFSTGRVAAFKQAAPDVPAGFITLKRLIPKPGVELLGPFWPILLLNPAYVWAAHRRGQVVCPLDPWPDSRLWYYRLLGCDAVLTNNPAKTLRALKRV
jgi:glycerophosphoryl diester phosphodiesterase